MREAKTVISVGAGINQVPFIQALVRQGMHVVGFDLDEDAPGKELCSHFANISTWDYEKAIKWLDQLNINYAGVGCFSCGKAIITQQKIANHYQLVGNTQSDYYKVHCDKAFLREKLLQANLSSLVEQRVKEIDLQQSKKLFSQDMKYIVKPVSGISSKGIHTVDGENIQAKLETLMDNVDNDLIIQPYLDGKEYRIVGLIQDKKIKFLALLIKENLFGTVFTGRLYPHIVEDWSRNLVNQITDAFQVGTSAIKIDVIKNGENIEILDLDFGIPGDYFETFIAQYCLDYDYINQYIRMIINEPIRRSYRLSSQYQCFDYIYIISNKCYKFNLKNISEILKSILGECIIVPTKRNGTILSYPKSNLDNIVGVIHSRKDISHQKLCELVNERISQ